VSSGSPTANDPSCSRGSHDPAAKRFPRLAIAPLALILLAIVALVAGGCGGNDRADAEKLLDTAFSKRIPSADLAIDATLNFEGSALGGRPLRIQATGPYVDNRNGLPKVDLTMRVGSPGGQMVESGYLSTGDRAFVKFQDVFYELSRAEVQKQIQDLRRNRARRSGSLRALGLDPRRWLANAEFEDDVEVGGVDTRHVRGRLNVRNLLRDLDRLLARNREALSSTGGSLPTRLTPDTIRTVESVVRTPPTFDVYVGKEDGLLRRLAARIELDLTKLGGAVGQSLGRGTVTFSIQFTKIGERKRIAAPVSARPIGELRQLLRGSTSSLLGGVGTEQGSASASGGSGTTTTPPSAEQFRRYGECLDRARAGDIRELQRCANILRN